MHRTLDIREIAEEVTERIVEYPESFDQDYWLRDSKGEVFFSVLKGKSLLTSYIENTLG